METKRKIFNIIILDESGSMGAIKSSTIEGFNETVQTIKGTQLQHPGEMHYITLVTFNGLGIKTMLSNQPVMELTEIDVDCYRPGASTPLYDAMGMTLKRMQMQLELVEHYNVLVTIFTDGQENASKEFDAATIRHLVEELKARDWTFTYIGANHDVRQFAQNISINNTLSFESRAESVQHALSQERSARMRHYQKLREQNGRGEDYFSS